MCQKPPHEVINTSLDNVLVIIPVRNEEVTIAGVIGNLQAKGLTKIRVIDNGSSDRSAIIAQQAHAEVHSEIIAGYGQACWRGLQALPPEIEWILFADGDGSDDLDCLPGFFHLRADYDLILGDRTSTPTGKAVLTPVQHFGNRLAGWLINCGWGYRYRDLGPLRLIRRSALEQIGMQDRGFGWTVEMQVRAIEENLKICELPVNYYPRQGGKSKISGTILGSLQAGTIILTTLSKLYLQAIKNKKLKTKNPGKVCLWLSVILLLIGAVMTLPYGDFRNPENVVSFGYGMGIMSLGFICSWRIKDLNCWWFWLVAIATRVILLFMYPGDDIWRYLWEGQIQLQGFSPYDFAPNAPELIPYRTPWWSQINHQSVSAIYPPLTQWGFRGLAALNPSVILFKSSFAISDLVICWLLTLRFSYLRATLYSWNPLVIYSFAGGGHYDSWFILPLVVAWFWFDSDRWQLALSALFVGISVAIKWISLPILGFVAWVAWCKFNLPTAIVVAICGVLPFALATWSFCGLDACSLVPTSSTFVSHGRSAEFLPHLLAQVWQPSLKTNSILAIPLALFCLFLILKTRNFQLFSQNFFAGLLLISPIIHGWYFTWIIPFAVATTNWGVRLISISALIYFRLPYRQALGDRHWNLTDLETALLWLPFILGYVWSLQFPSKT